ncbi:uncharacterized protein G2W53_032934 [Senna tora]|uniref:Uncharacterized protein n=1 Tax=Senna tora TaxID=362788 RepID=A0A834SWS9_9FABA|nr:uncharacterized protein G2W53_032934 [Senna tora]
MHQRHGDPSLAAEDRIDVQQTEAAEPTTTTNPPSNKMAP